MDRTNATGPTGEVTVVIATRNRRAELCAALGHLAELPERPSILVVDNGSSDGTPPAVRRAFPHVAVLPLPSNVGAAARSVGARLATTPFVAFSDDDSWWADGSLATAVGVLRADPEIGLLAARILVGTEGTTDPTSELMEGGALDEWLRPSPVGPRGVTGFLACAAVVRRSAFLAVGGFDRHLFLGGEEELVSLDLADAGWKLVYAPRVVAHHHPSARRDVGQRQRLLVRNRLLTTWLRYSAARAGPRSARALATALAAVSGGTTAVPAFASAVRSGPWALAHRRAVRPEVERAFAGGQDT